MYKQLKIYLIQNDITMQQLADKIDFTRTYLSSVSLGRMNPGRKFCEKLAEATNGELSWEPKPKPEKAA